MESEFWFDKLSLFNSWWYDKVFFEIGSVSKIKNKFVSPPTLQLSAAFGNLNKK